MEKYIHYFNNGNEFEEYINNDYKEPFVCNKIGNGVETTYNDTTYELGDLGIPLTFEIVSGGTLYWYASNTGTTRTIEYRKNGGE